MTAGNPISTRLESGVGNCFPGLEFDIRNLERRFFPFLEVEFGADSNGRAAIFVVSVDSAAVNTAAAAGTITPDQADAYRNVANGLGPGEQWTVSQMDGATRVYEESSPFGRDSSCTMDSSTPRGASMLMVW